MEITAIMLFGCSSSQQLLSSSLIGGHIITCVVVNDAYYVKKHPPASLLLTCATRNIEHCFRCVLINQYGGVIDDVFCFPYDDVPPVGTAYRDDNLIWTIRYQERVPCKF
jgi:hypothetical protein